MSTNKIRYKRNKFKRKNVKETPVDSVDEQWSNTKIHNELSSFIAEFSYLEDSPPSNYYISTERSSQSHYIHPEKNKKHPQNKFRINKPDRPTQIKKHQRPKNVRNKSVEWRDITVELTQSDDGQCDTCCSHKDVVYSKEFKQSRSKSRGRRLFKRSDKKKNQPVVIRDKSPGKHFKCRRARSEEKKCCHPFKINKSRQSFSLKPQDLMVRRRSRSRSKVKYWPLRYERKNPRKLQVRIKRRTPIPETKLKLPSESPTIIKLYPQNADYINVLDCDASRPILTHEDLPCKCTKCVTKFELVKKIPEKNKHKHTSKVQFQVHAPIPHNKCLPIRNNYRTLSPYSPMTRHCQPFYPRFPGWPGIYPKIFPRCFDNPNPPCISPFTIYSDSTDYEDCFAKQRLNSFSIKCNSYGQPINSAITHYFHSILNQQFSCG